MTEPLRAGIAAARERENAAFAELMGGPANLEALAAFAEGREADFTRCRPAGERWPRRGHGHRLPERDPDPVQARADGSWLPTAPGTTETRSGSRWVRSVSTTPTARWGCEGFLLGADGPSTLFLPLTYRGAELEGAEDHLVGATEHSELGPRWVYDGCGDPVFAVAGRAVLTGGTGVDQEYDIGDGRETRPTNAQVQGSGGGPTYRHRGRSGSTTRAHSRS